MCRPAGAVPQQLTFALPTMRVALACLFLLGGGKALAATCTSLGNGNWSAPGTWSCGAMPVAGDDVIIANGHTVTMDVAAGQCRDLTFNGGNQDSNLNIAGANALAVSGNVTMTSNSNGDYRTLNVGNGILTVAGNMTLVGPNNNRRSILAITNGAASVAGNITANSAGERIEFSGSGSLRVGGNWTSGGVFTRGTGTVIFNGAGAQTIPDYDFHHLTVAKAAGTATLSNTIILYGNFTNNGGFNGIPGNDTVVFAGAAAQTIGGTAGSSSFYRIDLNNANGLTINHNVTVSNRFRFQNGRVTTAANILYVGTGNAAATQGNITGSNANRYVVGNLARWIRTAGGNVAYDFPVGTTVRALVNLRFNGVTTGNYVRVATFNGDHPQIAGSGINPALSVNRYWSVANLGVVFNAASAQRRMIFNWVAADRDGGTNTNAFIARRYAGGAWSDTDLSPGRTATSITLNPYMDFGDFAVGEPLSVVVPGGFDGLEPGAVFNPLNVPGNKNPIRTKVSGAAMSIDIAALNLAKSAIQTTFVGDVRIELLDGSNNAAPIDANGCRASWVPVTGFAPVTLSFVLADNGRKNVSLTEPNAWRDVRLRMTYPAVGAPLAIGCSTDNFAIRPASFGGFVVQHADWESAGLLDMNNLSLAVRINAPPDPPPHNLTNAHKAGRPFRVTGTAVNALSVPTTNYVGAPSAALSSCVGTPACLALGTDCACTPGPGTLSLSGNAVAGMYVTTTATYDNTGAFSAQLQDTTFSNVDVADTPADCAGRYICSASINVGRFVPDHFTLTSGAITAACTSGPTPFTFMNQGFPTFTANIEARTYLTETVTSNYHSPDFGLTQLAAVDWQAENADSGLSLAARLSVPQPPVIWSNGVYALSTTTAQFRRAVPDNPDGPFDQLQVGVAVTDPDDVKLSILNMNPSSAGVCVPPNCTALAVGGITSVRFGRLRLQNTHGSELRALPLSVRSEFWNGSGFALNTFDSCTSLAAGNFTLGNWQPAAFTGATGLAPGGPWTAAGGLFTGPGLTAPAGGAQGSVDVTVDLSARPWLRGRWNDASNPDGDANTMYDDDPAARATFGVYRDRLIFRREVTR